MLLLDSGVWLAARDSRDRFHAAARELILDTQAAALDLTVYEVANVAVVRWRDVAESQRLVELVVTAAGERLFRIDASLAQRASSLAAQHDITVYDATYAACADARGWRLVSTDVKGLVARGLADSPADALA